MKRLITLISCLILTGLQAPSANASPQICYLSSFSSNNVMPAAIAPTPTGTTSQTINGSYISSIAMADTSASTQSTNNSFSIERGNLLLSPNADLVIGLNNASLYLKTGATVFLMVSERDLVLYDLSQTATKQVSILVDKNMLVLHPGQMLVLTRQNAQSFEALEARCHSIPYRLAQRIELPNSETKAFVAQFSILSAMAKIQPLRRLIASTDKLQNTSS